MKRQILCAGLMLVLTLTPSGALQAQSGAVYLPLVFHDQPIGGGYVLQSGSPAYIANIANALGCAWLGVSGRVFYPPARERSGLIVRFEGGGLFLDVFTGSAPKYGLSGWEVPLGSAPIATLGVYRLRLLSPAGQPLSDWVSFPTYADCNRNHVILNLERP